MACAIKRLAVGGGEALPATADPIADQLPIAAYRIIRFTVTEILGIGGTMIEKTYSRTDLMHRAGLKKADLDYCLAQGVLHPMQAAAGRGRPLIYGQADLVVAGLIVELKRHNVATSRMRELADSLYRAIRLARGFGTALAQIPGVAGPVIAAAAAQDGAAVPMSEATDAAGRASSTTGAPTLIQAVELDHYHRLLDPAYLSAVPPLYLLDIPADDDLGLVWRSPGDPSPVEAGETTSCLTISITAINRGVFLKVDAGK